MRLKLFVASLNDGSFVNIKADSMEVIDNMLHVKERNNLVAVIDLCAIVAAYLSERGD